MPKDYTQRRNERWETVFPGIGLESILGRILRIARYHNHKSTETMKPFGIKNGEADVLSALLHAGPPYTLNPKDITKHAYRTPGAITNVMDHLEEKGLIRRNADRENRRNVLVELTPEGLEMAREFRGMTMVEIGRELLSERGISTRGMDRSEVAKTFFSRAHSTSDFPLLFEGVINKMLRAQYEFAPEFWDKIARQTSVDDFRARGLYSAGVVNGMKKIPEGGEIKYTTLKESKETIRVETFGEGISYTRQAFINDDLGVFSIIPSAFVRHWDMLRGNLVWGLLTDNVKMSDGKGIFDTTHGNLLSGTSSALSETSLAAAKTAMMKQKDIAGQIIRMVPRYLVVSPENEMMAKKLITATTPTKSADVNVFAGAFDVIVEPRLTDPAAWYLMADPYAVDSLYYAYLEGNEGLRVDSTEEFKTDSMDYAVRGDFGAAAIDYRGIVKAAGK